MPDAIVIGAGLGGLAAALRLAGRGLDVLVLEAGPRPGGKAGQETVDGVSFDTGPSVLTLPEVLTEVFADAGLQRDDRITLRRPEPFTQYRWPDGVCLDIGHDAEATAAGIATALGSRAATEWTEFLSYCADIWATAAPSFVFGPAPGVATVLQLGLAKLATFHRVDPFRAMRTAIHARVREPHLRDLLARYATYNGSDPRVAPATLNCITHVEVTLGGYGVQGGIYALVDALVTAAAQRGVEIRCNAPVAAIEVDPPTGAARGVQLADGEWVEAPRVVCNADAAHLFEALLPKRAQRTHRHPPSTSGWTGVFRAHNAGRAPHTVLFPQRYDQEFEDLFDRGQAPTQPTVYLCAQDVAHGRIGWSDGTAPLFAMANAPALSADKAPPDDGLRDRVIARLEAEVGVHAASLVWSRTPQGLADRFPGSRGALYGASSNSMFAAFQRPANRVPGVRGVYLASGSAHPGGGMPLCLLSGREAARCALEDLPLPSGPR